MAAGDYPIREIYVGAAPISATNPIFVAGGAASGAPVTANPMVVGGRASSAVPTAVDAGDAIPAWVGLNGAWVMGGVLYTAADAVNNAAMGAVSAASNGNAVPLVTALLGFNGTTWDRVRLNAAKSLLMEQGPFVLGRATADAQIKGSAGFIHTISIAGLTATPTAGLLTVYDSLTETGTVLYAEWVFATIEGHTVILDLPFATGLYVGFDATLANVQATVSYR